MRHKERIQIIKELTEKLVQKYKDEIILGGIYGSVIKNTDTEYSDIDLLFIVKDSSRAKSINFRYEEIVVNLHIQKIKDIEKALESIELNWPFKMGGIFNIKVIYGDKGTLDKLEKKAKNISNSKLNQFIRQFSKEHIYSIFEAFDKLRSLKTRKGYHEKKILIFDMLILMVLCIAIVNKEFLSGNYYYILHHIHRFKKLPKDFQNLSLKILEAQNLDEIIQLSDILINNFLEFLENNRGEFRKIESLNEVQL